MESHSLKCNCNLSYEEYSQLYSFASELTNVYNKLSIEHRKILQDYYNKNNDFLISIMYENRKVNTSICLQSAKASVDYLKLFL